MHRTTYLVVCHHILNLVLNFVLNLIPPALLSLTFHLNHSGLPPTSLFHLPYLLHQPYGINFPLPFAHPTRFIRKKGTEITSLSSAVFFLNFIICLISYVVYLLYIMLCNFDVVWCGLCAVIYM